MTEPTNTKRIYVSSEVLIIARKSKVQLRPCGFPSAIFSAVVMHHSNGRIDFSGSASSCSRLTEQIRQLSDIRRYAPRLIAGEQVRPRSSAGLVLEIDVGELVPVVIPDDEARLRLIDGPRRREAAIRLPQSRINPPLGCAGCAKVIIRRRMSAITTTRRTQRQSETDHMGKLKATFPRIT